MRNQNYTVIPEESPHMHTKTFLRGDSTLTSKKLLAELLIAKDSLSEAPSFPQEFRDGLSVSSLVGLDFYDSTFRLPGASQAAHSISVTS